MFEKDRWWSPLVNKCYPMAENDWIFVELIDIATDFHINKSIKTNLRYGKVFSSGRPNMLVDRFFSDDEIILFKDNMDRFQFKIPNEDRVINCYAIKKEDIIGHFTKKEKE
jgi:hypothetical protein